MINKKIDLTLLKPNTTDEEMEEFLDKAVGYDPYSVCVFPHFVRKAHDYLEEVDIKICTVIGFPFGNNPTSAKIAEIYSIIDYVDEIDYVINVHDVKSNNWINVGREMQAIRNIAVDKTVKIILETCYLTNSEIEEVCLWACDNKLDFVKTSTGYGTGGATVENVEAMAHYHNLKVKASGGIRSLEFAEELIKAGADRIGCSALLGVEIADDKSSY